MSKTVDLKLGGEVIAIPAVLRFKQLRAAWPFVDAVKPEMSNIDFTSTCIGVVAAAASIEHPELTVEEIENRLFATEMTEIQATMREIMTESGLWLRGDTAKGEAEPPAGAANASTEISTES